MNNLDKLLIDKDSLGEVLEVNLLTNPKVDRYEILKDLKKSIKELEEEIDNLLNQ